jgi:hypothetical protein
MARKTRLQELRAEARERGFAVFTWTPGDGITRYRFFERPIHPHQNYSGPANGTCTALGLKAAYGYLYTGKCARGRWRGALRGLGARRVITPPSASGPQQNCDRMRREFDEGAARMATLKAEIKAKELPRAKGVKLVNGIRRRLVATRKVARKYGCRWPRRTKLPSGMAVPKKKPSPQLPLF